MKLHEYQEQAVEHLLSNKEAGLFLDMGLGKTLITLSALSQLMFDTMEVSKVLIIAPKRVADHTWTAEIAKWAEFRHFRVSKILGKESERKRAVSASADLYLINRENIVWLITHLGGAFPFDTVVIDELSSFKSPKAARFKALKRIRPSIKRVIGLTGTPAPNGLIDLWSQMYLIDDGARLGKFVGHYREKYFKPGKRNGAVIFNYVPKDKNVEEQIYDQIRDVCISMKAKDYLKLPPRIDTVTDVVLPPVLVSRYEEFERDSVMEIASKEISAVSAAALTNKLLQFSNGAVYDEDGSYHEVHNAKIEALGERLEAANGKPVLVFYTFKSDAERICKHLKEFRPHLLRDSASIEQWNKGGINVLLAHPASAGHGLNLQEGGHHIEWFGLNWSLELYLQAVARLDRQGQKMPVINNRLLTTGTMEADVLKALDAKNAGQEALLAAVKARVKKYLQR